MSNETQESERLPFRSRLVGSAGVLELDEDVIDLARDLRNRDALMAALDAFEASPDVRVIVMLNAAGSLSPEAYCDFLQSVREEGGGQDWTRQDVMFSREEAVIDELVKRIHRSPKVTVAGLLGEIATPFVGVALAFDFRYCAPSTRLSLDFVRLGVPPGGGVGFFLPRYVGQGRATEMLLAGQVLPAAEARELGLVTDVLDEEDFEAACVARAEASARMPTAVAAATKALLYPDKGEILEHYLELEFQRMRAAWRMVIRRQ